MRRPDENSGLNPEWRACRPAGTVLERPKSTGCCLWSDANIGFMMFAFGQLGDSVGTILKLEH
jgi:hypothetical protein